VTDLLAPMAGSLVGLALGLIGGGGSIIATPLLLYLVGMSPHVAVGTSAVAVSANALLNFVNHARAGNVRLATAGTFAATGVAGAFIGSSIGKAVDGNRLMLLFAILMLIVGMSMLRPRRNGGTAIAALTPMMICRVAAIAFCVGLLAGFFGIGGGFLIVPALIFATDMPIIHAIGTSLLAVAAFGLATALNYALSGLVDWPVAAEFIGGGIVGGWIGTRLACELAMQRSTLNRVFAGVIFVVALYIIWRSTRQT
jgi:uncharacterized membrane protein YfcA